MYISDESMQFLTDLLAKLYDQWLELDDSPIENRDSFLYLFGRIKNFIDQDPILYSVISDELSNSLICEKSDTDDNILIVNAGQVSSQESDIITVQEHKVSMTHLFPFSYPSDGHYGVLVGFYHEDIDDVSDIRQTRLTVDLTADTYTDGTETRVPIENPNAISGINPPLIMSINNEQIAIESIVHETVGSETITKGVVSDEYNEDSVNPGTTKQSHAADDVVFVYRKLEATAIFGVPVGPTHQSGGTAANFDYYPPEPANYMTIARVVVENPLLVGSGSDTTNILDIQDVREIGSSAEDSPFTTQERQMKQEVLNDIEASRNIVNFSDTLARIVDNLSTIVFENEDASVSGRFPAYWNTRPSIRSSYFIYGQQWNQFERFEFAPGFRQLWHDYTGEELLTTFGMFVGELMDSTNNSSISPPEIRDLDPDPPYQTQPDSSTGKLTPGDWFYAVTTVTSNGESPLSDWKQVRIPTYSQYNTITLRWDAVPGALYYHVYRKNSQFGLLNDLRLTADGSVTTGEFIDDGSHVGTTTRRGVMLTKNTSISEDGSKLYAYIPTLDDTQPSYPIIQLEDDITNTLGETQNGIRLILDLLKTDNTVETVEVEVPKGQPAGSSISIGDSLYKQIKDMRVELLDGQVELIGNRVNWSIQDRIYIQNVEV